MTGSMHHRSPHTRIVHPDSSPVYPASTFVRLCVRDGTPNCYVTTLRLCAAIRHSWRISRVNSCHHNLQNISRPDWNEVSPFAYFSAALSFPRNIWKYINHPVSNSIVSVEPVPLLLYFWTNVFRTTF